MIKAFKKVVCKYPNMKLLIFGHGEQDEKERIIREIIAHGLQESIRLGDFCDDVSTLISGAKVLLVPSQAYESFGLTIIEAMALGIPVVATDVGGIPEVLADSNAGFVCSSEDSDEFALLIMKILGDKELMIRMGQNGREFYESRYQATRMARSYQKLIHSSCGM